MHIWNRASIFIEKHSNCFYVSTVLIFIFGSVLLVNSLNHTTSMLKEKTEKAIMQLQMDSLIKLSTDQKEVITFQGEVLTNQRQNLDNAGEVIRQQNTILNRLIQYMKDLGEWPPKTEPIDPDKWTASI